MLLPGDAELYSNMGVVCYILESETHPFVDGLLKLGECKLLKSLIKQLHHPKIRMDKSVQSIIRKTGPVKREPVPTSSSADWSKICSRTPTNLETPSSSRFDAIDSEALAKEFQNFLNLKRPIRDKSQYKTSAQIRPNTSEVILMPIWELLAKRYQRRKNIKPQGSRASSVSLSSLGSLSEFDSILFTTDDEDEEEQTITNDPSERPYFSDSPEVPPRSLSDGPGNIQNDRSTSDNVSISDVTLKRIQRWKDFVVNGHWKAMEEDGTCADDFEEFSSDADYIPSDNSIDSDSDDESFTMSEMSSMSLLADEQNTIQANYPASIPCKLILYLF